MGEHQASPEQDMPEVLALCNAYQALDVQRVDIDQRLTALPADVIARDVLWDEMELVVAKLKGIVDRLAASPASGIAEMRAKAGVLAILLRSGDAGSPLIPERLIMALALSLTDDLAGFSG